MAKEKPHGAANTWGMVNRRGRLTWVVYHGDRLPANGKAVFSMSEQNDVWGATSSILFELPISGQDYYAWLTEAAARMSVPFRSHYETQKAKDGTGFWLIERMWKYGRGRGVLVWIGVAPGSAEGLTEFTLDSCNDAVSVVTLRELAQKSIDELWHDGNTDSDQEPALAPISRGGRPGLDRAERVYRLAKAMQAMELKKADPAMTWKEAAAAVGWRYGCGENGAKKLQYARDDVKRLLRDDPEGLLEEARETLRTETTKTP